MERNWDKLIVDLNAGRTINKYLSTDSKISVSRMKAENRPMTGLNGEVAQLLFIPGNVRLQDLQTYTTQDLLIASQLVRTRYAVCQPALCSSSLPE